MCNYVRIFLFSQEGNYSFFNRTVVNKLIQYCNLVITVLFSAAYMCGYFYGAYYIAHKCGLTTNTVKNQSLGSVRPYAFLSTLSVGNTA